MTILANSCQESVFRYLNTPVFNESGCIYVESGVPNTYLNGVVGGTINSKETVDKVAAYYQQKALAHCWYVDMACEPAFLQSALKEHGLNPVGTFPGMEVALDQLETAPSPEGLTLKIVENDEELQRFTNIFGDVFHFSNEDCAGYSALLQKKGYDGAFTHILGVYEGKAVSTGTLLCTDKGAFIYNVATVEDARKKGYAEAVCRRLLEEASQKGAKKAALVSSPEAISLYKKLGFSEVCQYHLYL